jgi:hypothetical protein
MLSKEEPQRCHSCGLTVIARFGDTRGWKSIQMLPNDAESFWHYCSNPVCQEAYEKAYDEALKNWRGVGDAGEEGEGAPEAPSGADQAEGR